MRPRGQALTLAALLALLLCVAVLATVSIGQGVHERVRLQHTADAAAYSLATGEARALNLYALVNRAHASHYVSAMTWQSLLSFLFFTEAFLTDLSGLATTFPCLAPSGAWRPLCGVAERAPGLGPLLRLLRGIAQLLFTVTREYQAALNGGDPGEGLAQDDLDRTVGLDVVPAFLDLNAALSAIAQSVMLGTYEELRSGGKDIVTRNDPGLPKGAVDLDASALSACLFARAHAAAALGRPGEPLRPVDTPLAPGAREDGDRVARAKRAMAGVANATRAGCDEEAPSGCPDTFLTARRLGQGWELPPGLEGVRGLLSRIPKWGQTRLLSSGMGGADGQNFIREPEGAPNVPTGMLAQGDNLGADDLYTFPLGPFACRVTDDPTRCWGEPRRNLHQRAHPTDAQRPFRAMTKTSIWALNAEERLKRPGGVHWRVAYPLYPLGPGHVPPADLGHDHPERARLGLHEARRRFFGSAPVSVYVANVRPIQDGQHPWPGVVPFPQFEPGQLAKECSLAPLDTAADAPAPRAQDFNQPSVWVTLEKDRAALEHPVDRSGSAAPPAIHLETADLHLDTRLGRPGSAHAAGLHAFARAQAYYHRPGDWEEPPNFFNPFWRARLAATLQDSQPAPPVKRWLRTLPRAMQGSAERFVTH